MSRSSAVLKVVALCGGVIGGLLLVVGIIMLINYCHKKCVKERPKQQQDLSSATETGNFSFFKSMPTITVSPPTDSSRATLTEAYFPQFEHSACTPTATPSHSQSSFAASINRHDPQQPSRTNASQRRTSVETIAFIESGSAAKQTRSFREASAGNNRSYGSLQERNDSPNFEPSSPHSSSPNSAQRPRRAESRRAAFKRNRQLTKSQRRDSRCSSKSSGSFEMDAIVESAEETQSQDQAEDVAMSKSQLEALKRQYEEARATAAKMAFRHNKPITWDVAQRAQHTRLQSTVRAQSASAALPRIQRLDPVDIFDEREAATCSSASGCAPKASLEIWRLRSTFEKEADVRIRIGNDRNDQSIGQVNDDCNANQVKKHSKSKNHENAMFGDSDEGRSSTSKRDRYKQALLRRRQMQHMLHMADSIDSNTTDNTSGRPADTATSFESNTSTATGMTGNSAHLSIISSTSAEEEVRPSVESPVKQSNSSSRATITAANSQARSPDDQQMVVTVRNLPLRPGDSSASISTAESANRERHLMHNQHAVIMLTPPDYAVQAESRRRIDSGYRSVEHRSLSLAASDIVIPTRSHTVDTPDNASGGLQTSLRPPNMLTPTAPYANPSDYRSRFASASAMMPRTSSSRLTSMDSERDSVLVDEEELLDEENRQIYSMHLKRSFDASMRHTANRAVPITRTNTSLGQYQRDREIAMQPRTGMGRRPVYSDRSFPAIPSAYTTVNPQLNEQASSLLDHYAIYRQRKLLEMSGHRSYERSATTTQPLVRGYSQPYSEPNNNPSSYVPTFDNSGYGIEKHYLGTGLVRAEQYDRARSQSFTGRRLPNPVGLTSSFPQRLTQAETNFGSSPQNCDDANRAALHGTRYF